MAAPVDPGDLALLQYTGGTTGMPKAAMLTHGSLLANARQMLGWFPQLRHGKEAFSVLSPSSMSTGRHWCSMPDCCSAQPRCWCRDR